MAIEFYNKDNKEPPVELTKSELFKLFNKAIDDGIIVSKDLYALEGRANKVSTSKSKKPRIKLEDSLMAYKYLLDNTCTVDEALCYSMEYSNLDEEALLAYVKLAKNNRVFNIKTNVVNSNKHSIQKDMIKCNLFNRKALNKCKTPNEQLTELLYQKEMYNRFKDLENANSNINQAMVNLTVDNIRKDRINKINKLISEIKAGEGTTDYLKEVAYILSQHGKTQKEISVIVNKDIRTVGRWLKN